MSESNVAIERWLPVSGFEGYYEVSDRGRVRSLDRASRNSLGVLRFYTGVVLKQQSDPNGYSIVGLAKDGVQKSVSVGHIVLTAFVGPCPEGMECCHYDNDRANSDVLNLRWDTHSSNMLDQVKHGTHAKRKVESCSLEHLLVEPNLKRSALVVENRRVCLACIRARGNRRSARRRGLEIDFRQVANRHYAEIMGL